MRDPGSIAYSAAIDSANAHDTNPERSGLAERVLREATRPAGASGAVSVFVTQTTQVILDIKRSRHGKPASSSTCSGIRRQTQAFEPTESTSLVAEYLSLLWEKRTGFRRRHQRLIMQTCVAVNRANLFQSHVFHKRFSPFINHLPPLISDSSPLAC
jgi:hypothetical protein